MKKIDKNIVYLGWVSFFTDMASSMVTTLLPIFVVYVLHEGVDKLGIIIAIATFVSYALRIVFGYLSDRYGIVKPFVVAGYFISSLTKPMLAFSHSYISVSFLRALERMGKAVRSAPKDALISGYAKNREEGRTFGFHKTMDIAGEMSGAIVIFIIFYIGDKGDSFIRTIFLWTLLPGLIATFIAFFLVKDMPAKSKKEKFVLNRQDYHLFGILTLYFAFLFFLFSDQYFIVRAKEAGFTLYTIPLLVIIDTLAQTLTSYYSGILIDRIGVYRMLLMSFAFGLFSIIALHENHLWIAFAMLGLFTVISLNSMRSFISKEAQSKGFVYGIFYAGVAIFAALGALVIGQIWHRFGFDAATLYSLCGLSVLTLIAAIISLRSVKKKCI